MQTNQNVSIPNQVGQMNRNKLNLKQVSMAIEVGKLGQKAPIPPPKILSPRNAVRNIYSPSKSTISSEKSLSDKLLTGDKAIDKQSLEKSDKNIEKTTVHKSNDNSSQHSEPMSARGTRKSQAQIQTKPISIPTGIPKQKKLSQSTQPSNSVSNNLGTHEVIATIPSIFNRKLSMKIIQKNALPIEHACCVNSLFMWIASKNKVAIYDCTTMRPIHQWVEREPSDSFTCIYQFGKNVWAGLKSGKICIWQSDTRVRLSDLPINHIGRVNEMIQCGNIVFSVAMDNMIHVWDSASLQYIGRLPKPSQEYAVEFFTSIILVPETFTLWISDNHGNIHIFSLQEGIFIQVLKSTYGKILRLRYTQQYVWSASVQGMVQVWNINNYQSERFFQCHKKAIPCLEVTESQVWSSSLDKSMHTYDPKELKVIKSLKSKNTDLWMSGLAIADNSRVWTLGSDNQIRIWGAIGKVVATNFNDIIFPKEKFSIQDFTNHIKEIIKNVEIKVEGIHLSIANVEEIVDKSYLNDNKINIENKKLEENFHPRKNSLQSDIQSDLESNSKYFDSESTSTRDSQYSLTMNGTLKKEKKKKSNEIKEKKSSKSSKETKKEISENGQSNLKKETRLSTNGLNTVQKEGSLNSSISKTKSKQLTLSPILKENSEEKDDHSLKTPSLSRDGDSESTNDAWDRSSSHPIDEISKSFSNGITDFQKNNRTELEIYMGDDSDDSFELGDSYSIPSYEKEIASLRRQLQNATSLSNHYKNRLDIRKQKLKEVKKLYWDLYAKFQRLQTEIFINNERAFELEQRVEGANTIDQEYQNRLLQLLTVDRKSKCNNLDDIIREIEIMIQTKSKEENLLPTSNSTSTNPTLLTEITPMQKEEPELKPLKDNQPQFETMKNEVSLCHQEINTLINLIEKQQSQYNQLKNELEEKKKQIQVLSLISDSNLDEVVQVV